MLQVIEHLNKLWPKKIAVFSDPVMHCTLLPNSLYSLIQEEIGAKFHWIGMKLGLIKKEQSDDDVDDLDELLEDLEKEEERCITKICLLVA